MIPTLGFYGEVAAGFAPFEQKLVIRECCGADRVCVGAAVSHLFQGEVATIGKVKFTHFNSSFPMG